MEPKDHRVRLTDYDLEVIVSALRARLPMARGKRKERIEHLVLRLEEMAPGNPYWRE
jgi:hypothetical protein